LKNVILCMKNVLQLKKIKMTLNDLKNEIKKTPISDIKPYEAKDYKKLIDILEMYSKADFGKLTLKEIEFEHPYFLLEISRPSVNAFLLYKKLISELK